MPSPLAAHLAERFAADARGLRARAAALAGAKPGAQGGAGGLGAASYARMAEACDRIERLFADAAGATPDDDALRALLPRVAGLVAEARSADERNVYAGAVARLSEGLGGGDDDDDGEDDV